MKFSIRELFLVTVIVALALGWWVNRQAYLAKVNELQKKNNVLQEKAMFLQTKTDEAMWSLRTQNTAQETPNPSAPALNPPKP